MTPQELLRRQRRQWRLIYTDIAVIVLCVLAVGAGTHTWLRIVNTIAAVINIASLRIAIKTLVILTHLDHRGELTMTKVVHAYTPN